MLVFKVLRSGYLSSTSRFEHLGIEQLVFYLSIAILILENICLSVSVRTCPSVRVCPSVSVRGHPCPSVSVRASRPLDF